MLNAITQHLGFELREKYIYSWNIECLILEYPALLQTFLVDDSCKRENIFNDNK